MTLADLAVGQSATIESVEGNRGFRRRLLELGLLPGTSVSVLRQAPLGDPLELTLRDTCISIRKRDAAEIHIDPAGS